MPAPYKRRMRLIPGGCPWPRTAWNRAGGPASCFVLHHMGFFVPRRLRAGRWALTPPFHPCRTPRERGDRRSDFL